MPRALKARLPQPLFAEPQFNETGTPTADPTAFRTPHDPNKDKQLYTQLGNLLKKDTVSFPVSSGKPEDLFQLENALGSQGVPDVADIRKSGKIVFHVAGDTGASSVKKLPNELHVADHLTNDFHSTKGADRPSFLFHLGDVVYNFGEWQYYYDQFYEPFRNYPAPIIPIPGNHDSFTIPGTKLSDAPLATFIRNFCSKTGPNIVKDAGSLHRTAMTLPGVYFALEAPFVRIIGLFSNALEDPGVISSQKGQSAQWPGVPDYQLSFLTAQLRNIKAEHYAGAILLAVHHPPFVYWPPPQVNGAGSHVGNTPMLREIDTICQTEGVYPHAVISGHAHNYQRFTRRISFQGASYSVPFIVVGDSGHNVLPLVWSRGGVRPPTPAPGSRVDHLDLNPAVRSNGLTIDQFDEQHYGYLRVTVDTRKLTIDFHPVGNVSPPAKADTVIVDIPSHTAT